jgi:L-fuconolactonase
MDAVGVDGAILVNSARHYGIDNRYALESASRHPERFRVVIRVDPEAPDVAEQIAAARADPRIVGARLLTMIEPDRVRFREGRFDPVFAAAQASDLPLCLYPTGTLPLVDDAARRFADLRIVVDHLGLAQRPFAPLHSDLFERLPELLALARHPNVAVKLSGIPALSWDAFPYAGVWPHVQRVLDAFGVERVMWGSDATRVDGIATYAEGLRWLTESGALGGDDLAAVLGGTLRHVFGWPA